MEKGEEIRCDAAGICVIGINDAYKCNVTQGKGVGHVWETAAV